MSKDSVAINLFGTDVVVKSPYRYAQAMRSIPGGVWDAELKAWIYHALPATVQRIHDLFTGKEVIANPAWHDLTARVCTSHTIDARNHALAGRELPPPPKTRTKPWPHQCLGYHLINDQIATMLAYDMGTGKSKCVVDAACNCDNCDTVLICCPLSVVSVWPREFAKHAAVRVRIAALDKGTVAEKAKTLTWHIEAAKARKERLVVVVNYESAWRPQLAKVLESRTWGMIVCDESHRIKSHRGVASKFIRKLGRLAVRRVCLTGTPMPHSPLDVWAQYAFLDPRIFGTSFTSFRCNYANMGGFNAHEIVGFKNLEDLHERFYRIAHRVQKRDVLDLPAVTHERIDVKLGAKAGKVYQALETDLVAQVGDGLVTAMNALSKLLRLQQVTSGFAVVKPEAGDEEGTVEQIDTAKADALKDLIEDLPAEEPIVVFCRFRSDLDAVHRVADSLQRRSLELSGRRNQLADWQQVDGPPVLAVQIQSGGVGIDLTRACYCAYFSLGFSLGDYEQSLARTDRPGQTRPVTYYHLVATGTVDDRVYQALSQRKQVVEHVLETLKGGTSCHQQPSPKA